jgi:hypothetical protein
LTGFEKENYSYIRKDYNSLFTVLRPAHEFFTYMETSPLPGRAAKLRPMLGAQGL